MKRKERAIEGEDIFTVLEFRWLHRSSVDPHSLGSWSMADARQRRASATSAFACATRPSMWVARALGEALGLCWEDVSLGEATRHAADVMDLLLPEEE